MVMIVKYVTGELPKMSSTQLHCEKDQIIFRIGETGDTAYVLIEGSVEISIEEENNKTVLAVFQPVSVFGEMALLLKDQKRTATARAISKSKLATISRNDFDDFINQSPKVITAVLKAIVSRLQLTTERITHSPELYMVIIENLNLLIQHRVFDWINYDLFAQSISKSIKIAPDKVQKTMQFLTTVGLIDIQISKNKAFINIPKPKYFMDRAMKIHTTFLKVGITPDDSIE